MPLPSLTHLRSLSLGPLNSTPEVLAQAARLPELETLGVVASKFHTRREAESPLVVLRRGLLDGWEQGGFGRLKRVEVQFQDARWAEIPGEYFEELEGLEEEWREKGAEVRAVEVGDGEWKAVGRGGGRGCFALCE